MRFKRGRIFRKSLAVAAALFLPGVMACAEDRIIFVDDFVMNATVVGYNASTESITLGFDKGTLAIPKNRIRAIEYDTTVTRNLPADNRRCVELAELMAEHGGVEAGIDVLETLRARGGAPEDLDLRLAKLYEKIGKYSKAIERLRSHLARHPANISVQGEIDKLMDKMKGTGDSGDEQKAPVIDIVTTQVEEGMEDGGWLVEPWGNPGEIQYIPLGKKADRILKVEFSKTDKDKVAVRKNLAREISDLTKNPVCAFDVYNNTTTPMKLAMAVVTSPGWQYFESKQILLPPRQWKQAVEIDLSGKDFKCEESEWKYTSTIKNLKSTIQVLFLLYETEDRGTVFFNNIEFK